MADVASNLSDVIDFRPYLQSICHHYQQWWMLYTLTDAEGKEEAKRQQPATWDAPFDFGLMVQTHNEPESGASRTDAGNSRSQDVERLPVLEGIRKYANNHVLLVGRPGSGKSTAMVRLLLEETLSLSSISQSTDGNLQRIPVLIELRFWQQSIVDLIRNFFRRHNLSLDHAQIENLLFQNRLLLLVDGLNELPSEAARQDVVKLRRDYPEIAAIFTTRDLNIGGDFGIQKKLEMQPLTTAQMQDFVRSHLTDQAELMLRQLGDRLKEFGQTPLLLWMLCSLFKQTGQIPTNLGGVFRAFTQGYERNLKQDVMAEGDRRWWSELLQNLAFTMMHSQPLSGRNAKAVPQPLDVELRVAIAKTEAYQIFVDCLQAKEAQPEGSAWKCLDDLLRHHLIQSDGEQIEFRHQLIQEYYAAEYLLTRVEKTPDLALQQHYLNYLKWTEPIALMLALVEDEALAKRVIQLALDVDLMLGARLAGEVKPPFQETMIRLVEAKLSGDQELPEWLKLQLYAKMKPSVIVTDLLKRLKDKNLNVRQHAIFTLGTLKSEEAIDALLVAMQDIYADVRRNAAETLIQLRSDYAIPGLMKLRQHPQSFVQRSADEVLQAIGGIDQAQNNSSEQVGEQITSSRAVYLNNDVEIKTLVSELTNSDPQIRMRAAQALGSIGFSGAVPTLLELLEDPEYQVCKSAAEALGKIGSTEAIPKLLKLLRDSDFGVRWIAVEALGSIGSPEAVPGLLPLLNDPNFGVLRRVARALGRIGSTEAIPELIQLLDDTNSDVREIAAEALGKLGSHKAVPGLIRLLDDANSDVRRIAAEALGKIGSHDAIPGLLRLLSHPDFSLQWEAADALGKIGSHDMIPELLKLVDSSNADVRRSVASLLGKLGSSKAIPGLLKLLNDTDFDVQWRAAESLIMIGSPEAVSSLLKLLNGCSADTRWRAAETLGRIGSQECVLGLIKLLDDAEPQVRWRAAELLGRIGPPAAVPGLINLLSDSDADVRWRAAEALGMIGTPEVVPELLTHLGDSNADVQWKVSVALRRLVEKRPQPMVEALPQISALVPYESGATAYSVILAIQSVCKFYNYSFTQRSSSINLLFSYSHKDEALRDTLATHLTLLQRQGIINTWHDRNITAGTEWAQAIDRNLNQADIILLLISANFLASDYCYDIEMQRALERHHQREARVIPILLKPCDWETAPFGKLQALPIAHGAGVKPVTLWSDADEAFTAIAQGIRKAAEELQKSRVNNPG